jgi:hypothetical protein
MINFMIVSSIYVFGSLEGVSGKTGRHYIELIQAIYTFLPKLITSYSNLTCTW